MNWKATLGAFVTMCIVTLIGVLSWFRLIEEADERRPRDRDRRCQRGSNHCYLDLRCL
jgi:hypothetical protein